MSPRPRAVVALCLALFLGWPFHCAQAAPAAPPPSAQVQPLTDDERTGFKFLGLRIDDKTGQVFKADGAALTPAELARYRGPYDFHKEPLNDDEKDDLLYSGNRFDEDTGHILSVADKKPLTVLAIEVSRRNTLLGQKHAILERLSVVLSQQEPGKPLSPQAQAQVKALVDAYPGALPPSLVKTLTTPGLTASALNADALKAYEDSTRFFDGQTTLKDLVENALPVQAKPYSSYSDKVYFDDSEKRLGGMLRTAVQGELAKNPAGQELLDHFRNKKGEVELPNFLILNIDPKAMASYSSSNKAVTFNQKLIVEALAQELPKDKQAALRKELADSRKFAAYLLAHPEGLQKSVAANGTTFLHELTHAWQDRRDRLMVEVNRGNMPGVMFLENEHEAFLAEMRWLHARLIADPAGSANEEMLESYRQFIVNPDLWRNDISQRYLANWPQFAATLPTAQDLQKQRISTARRLMGEGLYQRVVQGFKVLVMERGTQEMRTVESANRKRVAEFDKTRYPAMRAEGMRALAELYIAQAEKAKGAGDREEALDTAWAYALQLKDEPLTARIEALRAKKKGRGR
ncbi:MAG: hypothetical protein PHU21_08835 [Elusimicrobia bacterium]|nr:hypothetical protein [Elusimicrobiota bacterium]